MDALRQQAPVRAVRALVTGLIAVALLVIGTPAVAAPAQAADCDAGGPGTRLPVLLVHGFNSGPGAWSADTRAYFSVPGRTCVSVFDYAGSSTRWVTDPAIAPRLAERINQLARDSRAGGGPGTVALVVHSMGGLAVRCAADQACSGVPGVAGNIRGVATLGTPHRGTMLKSFGLSLGAPVIGALVKARCLTAGPVARLASGVCSNASALLTSDAARAFTPGSGQLAALPPFRGDFPVLALAGSVRVRGTLVGRVPWTVDVGDMVVSEDSALGASRRAQGVGGEKVIDCGVVDTGLPYPPERTCWHGSETDDVQFRTAVLQFLGKLAPRPGSGTPAPGPAPLPPAPGGLRAPDELVAERHNESGSTFIALGWTPVPGATGYEVRTAAGPQRTTATTHIDSRTESWCTPNARYDVVAVGAGGTVGSPATVTVPGPVDCTPEIRLVSVRGTPDAIVADVQCVGNARGGNGTGTVRLLVDGREARRDTCRVTDGSGVAALTLTAGVAPGRYRVQATASSPSGTKNSGDTVIDVG